MNLPPRPDDAPPPPPPLHGRDPLLDDPLFAELVGPPKPAGTPELNPPDAGSTDDPLFAEPVADAKVADLPVAEPLYAEPVEQLTTLPPRATPIRSVREPEPQPPSRPRAEPPRRPPLGPVGGLPTLAGSGAPPKPRWASACCVMGCLGGAVLGSVAFLAFVAMTILGQLGSRFAQNDPDKAPGPTGAAAWPGPIAPTAFGGMRGRIQLGGECDALCRGAGGRFLFFRIPSAKQIKVFDANAGDIVHTLDVADEKALFAAGAAELFVYLPKSRTVERYNLVSWARVGSMPLPDAVRRVDAIAVGAGSDRPLYLVSTHGRNPAEVRLLDGNAVPTPPHTIPEWWGGDVIHARASDDGRVLCLSGESGAVVVHYSPDEGFKGSAFTVFIPPQRATPSPDGEYIHTPRGVFKSSDLSRDLMDGAYTVPAAHGGDLFLRLTARGGKIEPGAPDLCLANPPTVVGSLTGVRLPDRFRVDEPADARIPADQRVYLWPAAGLAGVIPASNDRLELFRVNVAGVLQGSGLAEYAVFGSDPPKAAVRGRKWSYRPTIWARDKRPELDVSGLSGVKRVGDEVVWTPTQFQNGPYDVTLTLGKPNAEYHSTQKFRLFVLDADE